MANPAPAGSDVSAGTYKCTNCGYELQVRSTKNLPPCPKCDNGKWNTVSGGDSVHDPYPGRKRGSSASSRSKSSRTRSSSKASSKRSAGSSRRTPTARPSGRGGARNGAGPTGAVKDAVSDGADTAKGGLQSAGEVIGGAARKAKLPALAGGAALAGLAGTLALTSDGLKSVRLPGTRPSRTQRSVKAFAGAGRGVGQAGGQLSVLAQRADELTALVECVNKTGKRSKRRRIFRR